MDILVFEPDKAQCRNLYDILNKRHYRAATAYLFAHFENSLAGDDWPVVILNIHAESVDNRTIRKLTIKYPRTYFLGLTEYRFNPNLRDAICYHLFACLFKPVDPDELFYWLRCIEEENDAEPRYRRQA